MYKRHHAIASIKHYIASQGLNPGDRLPPCREIAKILKAPIATTFRALSALGADGSLAKKGTRGRGACWIVAEIKTERTAEFKWRTKVEQVENALEQLLSKHNEDDRLPTIRELASQYDVSYSTARYAVLRLHKRGLVHFKRGQRKALVNKAAPVMRSFKPGCVYDATEEDRGFNEAIAIYKTLYKRHCDPDKALARVQRCDLIDKSQAWRNGWTRGLQYLDLMVSDGVGQ